MIGNELWVKWVQNENITGKTWLFTVGDIDPISYKIYTMEYALDIINRRNLIPGGNTV